MIRISIGKDERLYPYGVDLLSRVDLIIEHIGFFETQDPTRASCHAFTTCQTSAIFYRHSTPGMTPNIDPNWAVKSTYPTLNATC
jgi:hypothetical protein